MIRMILEVMRRRFCEFQRKDIRGAVQQMLKEGMQGQEGLVSETGKVRINDNVRVWAIEGAVGEDANTLF